MTDKSVEIVLMLTFPEWEEETNKRVASGKYNHKEIQDWLDQKFQDGCKELGLELHRIH